MSKEQISLYYQHTPVYLWPVLWLSILRTRAWMELESLRVGGRIEVVIGLTRWGTLHIVAVCDEISGYTDPNPHRYDGKITFAALCEGFTNTREVFSVGTESLHLCALEVADNKTDSNLLSLECAAALIPVP